MIEPNATINLVIPFRFLPQEEKIALEREMPVLTFNPGEMIFERGAPDRDIYLLEEGQVELIYEDWPHIKPANVVRSGHYFGERGALLDQNRTYGAKALTLVRCRSLGAQRFLDLIHRFNLFAQTFGTILRDKHGIFLPLEHFINEVTRALILGHLPMPRLLELYMDLEPAIHRLACDPIKLDLGALSYGIRRLPDNVTTTYAWFFTDDIPATYQYPDRLFPLIPTQARRREIWEMGPGKNMVLLRSGTTDLLDLISNLCLFTIEGRKLRLRLHDPKVLLQLKESLDAQPPQDRKTILAQLPFSKSEQEDLWKIWGELTPQRLYEVVIHHEDYALAVERQLNNYNFRRSEKWIVQVAKAVKRLMGVEVEDFPADWEVHIISSNTHSVTNLLSSRWNEMRPEILKWAKSISHKNLKETWNYEEDLGYSLLQDYLKAFPDQKPTAEDDFSRGILNLKDTSSTGIQVQLVDTRQLRNQAMDPWIPPIPKDRTILIMNIDYAFGEQAAEILRNLITLFQKRIRSISILGKAGGLLGQRGDTLIPTAFLKQTDDDILPLPAPPDRELDRLVKRLGKSRLHLGPLLTVKGTLLQNQALLQFYRNIWRCTGLEMEGDFFARKVQQSQLAGHLDKEVVQRYYYYVSDLPLEAGANLSQPMTPGEGIPPLYAITREVLMGIFE